MELGSMHITGTIDTNEIDRGLTRIDAEMKEVDAVSKSMEADFTRMNQSTKSLVSTLGLMELAGVAAMIGLAKNAPGTAAAMAGIDVATFSLSNALGNALAPAFEKVGPLIQEFADFITENQDTIGTLAKEFIDVLAFSVETLHNAWNGLMGLQIPVFDISVGEGLKWLVDNFGAAIVGAWIGGKIAGLAGAAIGAGVGMAQSTGSSIPIGASIGAVAGVPFAGVSGGLSIPIGMYLGSLIASLFDQYGRNNSRQQVLQNQTNSTSGSGY